MRGVGPTFEEDKSGVAISDFLELDELTTPLSHDNYLETVKAGRVRESSVHERLALVFSTAIGWGRVFEEPQSTRGSVAVLWIGNGEDSRACVLSSLWRLLCDIGRV